MPSAHGPYHFIMERQKSLSSFSSAPFGGEACTFICTECGDGFPHYTQVIAHMTIHGPLESFSFDGSSNGFEVPREYVLQENGTLAVVNGFSVTHSSPKPASPEALPHYPYAAKPPSPKPPIQTPRAQSCNSHPNTPRSSDLIVEKPQPSHYRCEICSKSFHSLQSLRRHQQYNNTEEGYKCTLCCKTFAGRLELKAHFKGHARQPFHCCRHCGKRFIKAHALVAHEKESHLITNAGNSDNNEDNKLKKTYLCRMCKLHFFWMSDFQTHVLYQCKGKEFNTALTDVGLTIKHRGRPIENCYSNGTVFDIENGNEDDENMSQIDTSYRYDLSNDPLPKLRALKEHHFTHQNQEEIDPLDEESGKPKQRIKPRSRYRRRSPNGKLYPCKHCQRVFNHSSSLSRHMRYHKGTMHACTVCGRRFPQRCDLTSHIARFHKDMERTTQDGTQSAKLGRANYKCQDCGKTFGLMCVYQRHLTYHKRGQHKCHLCSARFMDASTLQVHLQNHPSDGTRHDLDQSCHVTGTNGNPSLVMKSPADIIAEDDMVDHTPNDNSPTDSTEDDDMADSTPNDNSHADNLEDDDMVDRTPNDKSHSDSIEEATPNKDNSEVHYECTDCTETFSCFETFLLHQTSHVSKNIG
uniref:zinc finger protein 808 n=1 Tax=Doryrhamphus excisus TaxID=161450 RepID=UPI0025AE4DBF|nr:zinc finger protein 808 [Doryrhamphus excisus]